MQICLNDRQGSYSHPAKPLWRVLMVYFRADAWSPPPTARQGSARIPGLSIPGRGLQGPHSAARSCFRLFKIVFSCNILPRAAAAAAGACQSSQMVWTSLLPALSHISGVLPHGRHSERVLQGPGCRGQAPAAQGYQGIPSCKAMDASQGSGSALLLSDRDSPHTHCSH